MTQGHLIFNKDLRRDREAAFEQHPSPTPIDRILQKLSWLELPAKDHFESYLRHKWRLNHKPRTLFSSFQSVTLFPSFFKGLGKSQLEKATKEDLEAFIEHEQDRTDN